MKCCSRFPETTVQDFLVFSDSVGTSSEESGQWIGHLGRPRPRPNVEPCYLLLCTPSNKIFVALHTTLWKKAVMFGSMTITRGLRTGVLDVRGGREFVLWKVACWRFFKCVSTWYVHVIRMVRAHVPTQLWRDLDVRLDLKAAVSQRACIVPFVCCVFMW